MSDFETRYSFAGDEFFFVELSESYSLETTFRIIGMIREAKDRNIPGVVEVCAGNAQLMIRFNPDIIPPAELEKQFRDIEASVQNVDDLKMKARIIEYPIYFEDPWTYETEMRFREGYACDPTTTDIDYCRRINGFETVQDMIDEMVSVHYLVINVGFVPGLPWIYKLAPQERQIEVPKYKRPRTYTPERAFFYAGCAGGIYPAEGTGGAMLFGIAAAPVFDGTQSLPDFKENMVFPVPGDIWDLKAIGREEYDAIRKEIEAGTFKYSIKEYEFTPKDVRDFDAFAKEVKRRLYGND